MSASATLELTHATEPLAEGMTVESIEGFEELRSPRTQLFELALIVGWWAVWGIFMTGQYLAFFANVGAPVTVMGAAGRAYLGAG
jgi:hypothetical protein